MPQLFACIAALTLCAVTAAVHAQPVVVENRPGAQGVTG